MSMQYDDSLRMIEERFRAGKPSESQKRKRRASKRGLVKNLLPEIEALLSEGYSFEGISGYFADIGLHMPVTTLKNYVTRARRETARSTTGRKKPRKPPRAPANMSPGAVGVAGPNPIAERHEPAPLPSRASEPAPEAAPMVTLGTAERGTSATAKTPRPPALADGAAPVVDPEPNEISLEETQPPGGTPSSSFAVPRRKRLDDL